MAKNNTIKTSLRFFHDIPVRSVWDEETSLWWMAAVDVVNAITDTANPRVYWATVKRRNAQLFANCKQLKMQAADHKFRMTDVLSEKQVAELLAVIRSPRAEVFQEWFRQIGRTLDEKSREKAYDLFAGDLIDNIEIGTVKGLQQIHAYIFGGLYDFAGQIRSKNISKGGFMFASAEFLPATLKTIENMPEENLREIVDKFIEMNIAHPFMEGNGRSTRIWLDLILKNNLKKCVDWSRIAKQDYMSAMRESPVNPVPIFSLLEGALTDKINDREVFMKGIDYSYYYEEEEA